jgi:hypothetical protein
MVSSTVSLCGWCGCSIGGGVGTERLPSAHTCFNHVLLPIYTNKEALRSKLVMALENSTGFGACSAVPTQVLFAHLLVQVCDDEHA